jgi:hypothetical protein
MRYSNVCRHHGGSAPQVKAKAAARKLAAAAQADAERLLAHEAVERMPDPWDTLSRLAVEADAMRQALAARVNALDGALRYTAPGAGTEQLRAEVALYERAMDRSAKFADLLIRHNWEAKKIELAEGQAQIVILAFRAALGSVSMLPVDRVVLTERFLDGLGRGTDDAPSQALEQAGQTLVEDFGGEIARVLRSVLDRLELTPHQKRLVGVVVPEVLRRAADDVVVRGEIE